MQTQNDSSNNPAPPKLKCYDASVKLEVYASQNEIKDLRQELKNKDGEIKSLHITNASHELDVYVSHIKIKDLHQKIEMLTSNYDKAAVVLNN